MKEKKYENKNKNKTKQKKKNYNTFYIKLFSILTINGCSNACLTVNLLFGSIVNNPLTKSFAIISKYIYIYLIMLY